MYVETRISNEPGLFLGMGCINDNFHILGTIWEFNKNLNNFVKL